MACSPVVYDCFKNYTSNFFVKTLKLSTELGSKAEKVKKGVTPVLCRIKDFLIDKRENIVICGVGGCGAYLAHSIISASKNNINLLVPVLAGGLIIAILKNQSNMDQLIERFYEKNEELDATNKDMAEVLDQAQDDLLWEKDLTIEGLKEKLKKSKSVLHGALQVNCNQNNLISFLLAENAKLKKDLAEGKELSLNENANSMYS